MDPDSYMAWNFTTATTSSYIGTPGMTAPCNAAETFFFRAAFARNQQLHGNIHDNMHGNSTVNKATQVCTVCTNSYSLYASVVPLPSQGFVELPLVCKPQNEWEAKSEGAQHSKACSSGTSLLRPASVRILRRASACKCHVLPAFSSILSIRTYAAKFENGI